jgi:glyoxylase-like metal-dependent hydrolase (beta-lactamase superfamily II)
MKIEFMGVGSGLSPELGNNNALIFSDDSDRQLLIDCGFSTPPVLTQRENGLFNISDILITHIHSDHVGGLELMGFTSFYVYRNFPNFRKMTLHVPTESLKNDIWQILEKGMTNAQTAETGYFDANLETYFDISVSETIDIDGFEQIRFEETDHVKGMEAYSIWIGDKVYYSSDTVKLPPQNANLIFQDCQLFNSPTSVHTEFDQLNTELDDSTKQKTWLMHYGFNSTGVNPVEHGFKGFVKRFDIIDLNPFL